MTTTEPVSRLKIAGRKHAWLVFLVLSASTRLPFLEADHPLEVEGTNAPLLDAYWYLTRPLAVAEGRDYAVNPPHDRPLHNALALPVLVPLGVSHATIALVGVLPECAGVRGRTPERLCAGVAGPHGKTGLRVYRPVG